VAFLDSSSPETTADQEIRAPRLMYARLRARPSGAGKQQRTSPARLAVATKTAMLGSASTTTQKSLCASSVPSVSLWLKSRLVIIIF